MTTIKIENFTSVTESAFTEAAHGGNRTTAAPLSIQSPEFAWLVAVCFAAIVWITYICYYNSRLIGLILTMIINRVHKTAHVKIGSFSFSVLSGKIMFRDVHYVTEDYAIRIVDGWAIFRWWRPYTVKDISEDFSQGNTRLSFYLEGLEWHVYNRSSEYARLEKLFNLDEGTLASGNDNQEEEETAQGEESANWLQWRDLIPVIKFRVSVGKFVFGNHLVPSTLSIGFDDGHFLYTTKPASTPFDTFMHVTKCEAENVRVMLVPSPRYTGPKDEPPRYMGEGFVVLQSNYVDIIYYFDEPGKVPYEPQVLQMASGDVVVRQTYPCWGMDIKCGHSTDVKYGKETNISYGPWADRQREQLYKFFYPADYQTMEVSKVPEPGQKRQFRSFDFRMNILADASIDILFTMNSETQAIHLNCGPASYVEAIIPYVVQQEGYTTHVYGQLLHFDGTTSMQFREFLHSETLEFDLNIHYPREWNSLQDWQVDLKGCKATLQFIFQHKVFLQYMIEDWSSKSVPDIYSFVPYTWRLNITLQEFELVTLTNEYNWIDCTSTNQENAHIAAGGEILEVSLTLPYDDFLPPMVAMTLLIKAENVDVRIHLPETNTTSQMILALSENMKIIDRNGQVQEGPYGSDRDHQFRRVTKKSLGWIDCISSPIVALNLIYTYHPTPNLQELGEEDFSMTTPELEDRLLVPLLPLKPTRRLSSVRSESFDPTSLDPDLFEVVLNVGPTTVCVYGTLLRNFLHLKENYFGEDQKFIDVESSPSSLEKSFLNKTLIPESVLEDGPFDPRKYRPMALTLSISLRDIQGHLIRHCSPNDPPCPSIFVDQIGFELDKKYRETKLQVLVAPIIVVAKDNVQRSDSINGHLALSSLQVRGHAMFSNVGIPLDKDTLEYAWLIEATIGDITGRLTAPQLQQIVEALRTFVFQVEDTENELQHPLPYKFCQHGRPQADCIDLAVYPFPCPTTEEIKYRLTRVSVDLVDVYVVEEGSALNLLVKPVHLATCNLHGNDNKAGVTALIDKIMLRQFIQSSISTNSETSNPWVEAGGLSLGPLNVDAAIALPTPEYQEIQELFLKKHDNLTRRLWFLWPMDVLLINSGVADKCGCLGGCTFFGTNANGINFFNLPVSRVRAVLQLNPQGTDLGYGQSLLHPNRMICDHISVHTAKFQNRQWSTTSGANETKSTVTEDLTMRDDVVIAIPEKDDFHISDLTLADAKNASEVAGEEFGLFNQFGSESTLKARPLSEMSHPPANVVVSDNDEFMPNDSMPDAYDTDRYASSQSSPESGDQMSHPQRETPVDPCSSNRHSRSLSDGAYSIDQPSTETGSEPISTVKHQISRQLSSQSGSKSSLPQSPALHRHSVVASPESQRSFRHLSSVNSLTGSEMYYSADEEMSESDHGSFISLQDGVFDGDGNKTPTQALVDSQYLNEESPIGKTPPTVIPAAPDTDSDSSTSTANSNASFCSANSDLDQIAMIDLHGQFNQPITKSPLLMSCYLNHLSHVKCDNWLKPPPAPFLFMDDETPQWPKTLLTSYVPQFVTTRQGFSTKLMAHKTSMKDKVDSAAANENTSNLDNNSTSQDSDTAFKVEDKTSKTTAVIKLTGSVDILVSPLSIESATRYVEALTPSLSKVHPSAVLDTLHICCSDVVQSQNRLKKAAQRDEANVTMPLSDSCKPKEKERWKSSRFQVLFSLKEINVAFLQASIVEETISFSALASPRELTCVSVLAVCFENISCQYLANNQSKKILDLPTQSRKDTERQTPKKKLSVLFSGKIPSRKKKKSMQRGISTDYDEDTELHTEEVIGNLHIARIHCQLQRLQKHGSIGNDVILTAIPSNQSKVLFFFEPEPNEEYFMFPVMSNTTGGGRSSGCRSSATHYRESGVKASGHVKRDGNTCQGNLIMFEMGIETIDFKVAKRSGFQEMAERLQRLQEQQKEFEEQMMTYDVIDEEKPPTPAKPTTPSFKQKFFISREPSRNEAEISVIKPVSPRLPTKLLRQDSVKPELDAAGAGASGGKRVSKTPSVGEDSQRSSWAPSRISFHSSEDESSLLADGADSKLERNGSNAVVEISTVWFNFAAPPPPKHNKKLDFTRLDWNLLSTATPAINAWLNTADRLSQEFTCLSEARNRRLCAVLACMMTDALDMPSIQMPPKKKYNKVTLLSKTLQEDPSCQLFTVMRRYVQHVGVVTVETFVSSDTVPQHITVQKGILAAVRQWKNQLYMPLLAEEGFLTKNFIPKIVSYEIDDDEENVDAESVKYEPEEARVAMEGGVRESVAESVTSPLKHLSRSLRSLQESLQGAIPMVVLNDESSPEKRESLSKSQSPLHAPLLPEVDIATRSQHKSGGAHNLQPQQEDEETKSVAEDVVDANYVSPLETPAKGVSKILAELDKKQDEDEDLYRWMARQQEQRDQRFRNFYHSTQHMPPLNTMISELTQDNVSRDVKTVAMYAPVLPDAHILFKPMLNKLGIHPDGINPSSFIQKLGGNVAIKGELHTLRIEIIDSAEKSSKGRAKGRNIKRKISNYLDQKKEIPTFVCKDFSVSLAVKDIVDFDKDSSTNSFDRNYSKRNRRLMDMLERKPVTTQIYFGIDVSSLTQFVNMPLLRLVNQMVRVVMNISETHDVLKQARPAHSEDFFRTHRKHDSSSSTDTHSFKQMDLARGQPMSPEMYSKMDASISYPSPRLKSSRTSSRRPNKLLMSPGRKTTTTFDFFASRSFDDMTVLHHESPTPTSPMADQKTIVDEIRENTPKCWRTLYHLLELYPRQTEPRMLTQYASLRRLPIIGEEHEDDLKHSPRQSFKMAEEGQAKRDSGEGPSQPGGKNVQHGTFRHSIYIGESTPLVIFGMAKINTTKIVASLSGLILESEVKNIQGSMSMKEKSKGVGKRKSKEMSVTAHMDSSTIKLLEGAARNKTQTVVTVSVDQSECLFSNLRKTRKQVRELNSLLVTVGMVNIDIPQHPVVLHGMVTRSTKRISTTLQEFWRRSTLTPPPTSALQLPVQKDLIYDTPMRKSSTAQNLMYCFIPALSPRSSDSVGDIPSAAQASVGSHNTKVMEEPIPETAPVAPLVVRIKGVLRGLAVGTSLLPSLRASYQIGEVTASGITGDQANFTVDLPSHSLSFHSKVPERDIPNVPSSASIDLPPVHVAGAVLTHVTRDGTSDVGDVPAEGLVLQEGSYLYAMAEVGAFEHTLTTDLLNHLVFAQKVFMKEINEVLQKMSGGEKPVPLWTDGGSGAAPKPLLYSFIVRLKCIQITATTPTFSAVRLETGIIDLELSNRVRSKSAHEKTLAESLNFKLFAKAQVDLNVSLGQLIKNPMFEEAEPEFQTLSFFKTRISIRNALPGEALFPADEIITGQSEDQEALLITLQKPVILVQPVSFDKAVMVWLNYKNAYDYWSEQRMALNTEVLAATQQVYDHFLPVHGSVTDSRPTTLFLQFTVDDLGICMPLTGGATGSQGRHFTIDEPGAVLCLTLENTLISACSCGSLVSKGKFTGFCLRFADEFEMGWDDWRPSPEAGIIMNACVVPQGTYEVCSKTIVNTVSDPSSTAKWVLNILWEMDGINVHLDTNIGQRLNILGQTLTALASDEELPTDDQPNDEEKEDEIDAPTLLSVKVSDSLPPFVYDTSMNPKLRVRLIEREMNEQARLVQDLKSLGAKNAYIDLEEKKLQELEAVLYHDFRRDIVSKIRAQSVKAASLKDKLGLGYKPSVSGHMRSRSAITGVPLKKSLATTDIHLQVLDTSLPSDRPLSDLSDNAFEPERAKDDLLSSADRADLLRRCTSQTPSGVKVEVNFDSASTLDLPSSAGSDSDIEKEYLNQASHKMSIISENMPTSQKSNPAPEPIIDLQMDIQVKINSGEILLHPKDKESKDEDTPGQYSQAGFKKPLRKEKSGASDYQHSPFLPQKLRKQESSSAKVKGSTFPGDNVTVFYSPGVDVKVQYCSKTSTVDSPSSSSGHDASPTQDDSIMSAAIHKRSSVKRADLYAWISLQKLPEEMQISPALLDFLEQALDPIMNAVNADRHSLTKPADVMDNVVLDQSATSGQFAPSTSYSFPVDIVVYVSVQPSIIRFNCLPVSRVECLLRLPSLDLVFSTKRAEVDLFKAADESPPTKHKNVANMVSNTFDGIRDRHGSGSRPRSSSGVRNQRQGHVMDTSSGGLSVTGCLADFSLFVFHPYGGGGANLKKVTSGMSVGPSYPRNDSTSSTGADSNNSLFQDGGRKDSLSLNVEFVKVNISRTRRSYTTNDPPTVAPGKTSTEPSKAANMVRFSAICDIGSATFKYDMRRLAEILSLPKAWYRKSLARRLFLGDESYYLLDDVSLTNQSLPTDGKSVLTPEAKSHTLPHSGSTGKEPVRSHHRRMSSGDKSKVKLSLDLVQKTPKRTSPMLSPIKLPRITRMSTPAISPYSQVLPDLRMSTPPGDPASSSTPMSASKQAAVWETLVLFAVNLSTLDVNVNMGNVMGNTTWRTKDIKSQGRLSIDSAGHKNMKLSAGVGNSLLDARGGIVGGSIEVQDLHTFVNVNEHPSQDPEHVVGVKLFALESRVDYMGSSILMTRISSLTVRLSDEWQMDTNKNTDSPLATRRPALVFVHGDLDWDQLHIMISRSTTPDLIKLAAKLEEYFSQQFISSRRIFSLGPSTTPITTKAPATKPKSSAPWLLHHRHWQMVLAHISGCHLPMLPSPLPKYGSILGGTMNLQGNNISLACFHGINFRSKFWALFIMKEPNISFATEAQCIMVEGQSTTETHVVQNLQFNLGHNQTHLDKKHKASILKLSRGYHMPPPFNSVQEWFQYAFACKEAAGMAFPEIRPHTEAEPEQKKNIRKYQEHRHETETIFALPALQLHLQTEHRQGEKPPPPEGPFPIVEVSFVTEFEDHIYVAMDAEVILFLHDVVMAYVKEKDKSSRSMSFYGSRAKSPDSTSSGTSEKKKLTDPTTELKKDSREFECKTWYLEPTVRLISWAGNRIEPIGVDYILQKLGFTRARVTIPKWMQRGCMDPLDKVVALLVDRLILTLRQLPPANDSDNEELISCIDFDEEENEGT